MQDYVSKQIPMNPEVRLKLLENILESIHDIVFVLDKSSRIIYANQAYTRFAEIPLSRILGRKLTDIEPGARILEVLETGKQIINDPSHIESLNKDIVANISPLYDENRKKIIGAVAVVRDITEVLVLQKKLIEIREEAEKQKELNDLYSTKLSELKKLIRSDDSLVFKSSSMKQVVEMGLRLAGFDSTVLITGESGVGKNVIAKLLHNHSKRSEMPFVEVNCGSIPENLLESELFGYERGAFTGANASGKIGLFEVANGGTLFLDEVGELPLNLQVKLLKVIQEQKFLRVGGIKPIQVDIRLISATNRDLLNLVDEGKFRNDLYYRLNVVPIHIPSLRERKDDIVPLINHFLTVFNNKYKFNKKLATEVYYLLENYSWPGNIRELENLIERLLVSSAETSISVDNKIITSLFTRKSGPECRKIVINDIIPLKEAKEIIEKELITKALEFFGSTRKAASILGLNHSNISRRIKKYKIKVPQ